MKMFEDNYLKLTLDPDDDGTGELTAEFHANGFAGVGSAYFNLDEIAKFAESLQAYPLPKDQVLSIEGGYWSRRKIFSKPKLSEVNLSIKIYVVSETGILGVRVKIQTPSMEGTVSMASGSFETGYNNLESFSKQILKLLRNETDFALLRCIRPNH